jgi:shikimate kinase/3-dehydroquinate synthase
MSRPIVLIGFMAAGKSVVGRRLASRLGRGFLDLDDLVTAHTGQPVADFIRAEGVAVFRRVEARALTEALNLRNTVVAAGGGAIEAPANRAVLARAGVTVVLLLVSPEEAWRRTAGPEEVGPSYHAARPLFPANVAGVRALLSEREPAYAEAATDRVETTGLTVDEVVQAVLNVLETTATGGPPLPQPMTLTGGPPGHGPVLVGRGLLGRLADLPSFPRDVTGPVFLVADPLPAALFAGEVRESLHRAGLRVVEHTLPGGEKDKSPGNLVRLWESMARNGLGRGALVVSLGGGACTDLAGLAAGTFMRGVRIIHLPTTLLAQVDAAVGGKTAVNLTQGKNLAGVFHFPSLVVADADTCRTLPPELVAEGRVELVKTLLAVGTAPDECTDPPSPDLVARAVRAKLDLVRADPFDLGPRQALNLGHTFGHGIETAGRFRRVRHGLAVGVGLLAATRLSETEGYLPAALATAVVQLTGDLLAGFPGPHLRAAGALDPGEIARHFDLDKKKGGRGLVFILLEPAGDDRVRARPVTGVEPVAAAEALEWALARVRGSAQVRRRCARAEQSCARAERSG